MKIAIKRVQRQAVLGYAERAQFGAKLKTFKLFSMAALALTMAACSNEDNELENVTPAQQGTMKFTATVAAPGSGAMTRTTYSESSGTINVAWKAGDQIHLFDEDEGQECTATVGTPAADGSATISGTFDYDVEAGENITATYPASAADDPATFSAKFASQAGTLAYIQDNLDYRIGHSTITEDGDEATLVDALEMKSQIAIWKLTLTTDGSTALSATKVTIKNGSTVIAATTDITATSAVYLALNLESGNISGADITIEATVGSDTYSYSKSGVSLAKGNYYQSTVTLTKPAPSYDKEVNLSTTSSDVTVPDGEHWLIKGSKGNICVTIGDGATVTLNGVEINMNTSKPCIKCSGDATIILADGTTNTLTATASNSGGGILAGPTGKTLTIKGNTGVLNVEIKHSYDAAAIGAYDRTACGDIVIEGGVINATSQNGAAIGACYLAPCGNITISGGTVTAKAGGAEDNPGVGIGGHYETACGNIKITGGTVTATGFNEPGIGGDDKCGDITISGGTVKATKGEYAEMSIGLCSDYGTCGTITIGGTVYWDGSNYQNGGDTYLTQDQIIYPAP